MFFWKQRRFVFFSPFCFFSLLSHSIHSLHKLYPKQEQCWIRFRSASDCARKLWKVHRSRGTLSICSSVSFFSFSFPFLFSFFSPFSLYCESKEENHLSHLDRHSVLFLTQKIHYSSFHLLFFIAFPFSFVCWFFSLFLHIFLSPTQQIVTSTTAAPASSSSNVKEASKSGSFIQRTKQHDSQHTNRPAA